MSLSTAFAIIVSLLSCSVQEGYLSAYDKTPTDATLAYRLDQGHDMPHAYNIAMLDCGLVGQEAYVVASGNSFKANVFDCAGMADGGRSWMLEQGVVAEIGWYAWQRFPSMVHAKAKVIVCERS